MPQAAVDPVLPADITEQARDLGPLESPAIWLTAAGAAVVVLAVTIALRHRRRVRRWGVSGTVVLVLLAAVTAVNSYVGYVRTSDDLARLFERGSGAADAIGLLLDDGDDQPDAAPASATAPHQPASNHPGPTSAGQRIDVLSLPDPAHAVPSGDNYVLLPPGYADPANTNLRYPVVYLIHGYPYGGPRDWLTSGAAPDALRNLEADHVIAPMIVVSVDLTAGVPSRDWEGLDVPGGPQLETYLARTVVPGVDQHYRTLADRRHRALGGMSGGAFAALNTGLHHLDEFATLLLALPYDDLNDSIGVLDGHPDAIAANTPRHYLPTMPFTAPISVLLTAGTGAPTDVATAHRIADALRRRGQEAVVHTEHGFNHTWHTARATLPYLLAFADQNFRSPAPTS
ncbi:alpha/beta hydrolase-fold protein [Amycolatopsis rhabdoformis]|uniref:Alpha/beta hydrolase-fold protein n=1 Tax=Amycolatopsis rhabdoformis TaxID=1448059 RepID=A0ABZ1IH74_9PSEU|nr:alpha/beta hydrolase-fold protein [Amycolatopsis rhabdoformis]WSE33068.1 alpha/beta hydrolase-fold protein [Amycolatopsis rhabdoformis]